MRQGWRQRQRTLLAVAGLGWLAYKGLQWGRQENLYGQVVLITGGSRGLGLALAREFARAGCRLVLAARDAQELTRAQQDLTQRGAEVLAVPCDVTDQEQVRSLVDQATQRLRCVDIVVNNAGIIQVGPMSTTTVEDFANAMDVMFWGALYPTLAVLPQMRARRSGHVVNITSIGGMVSVPHLLPYTCAKFAAVGLSEGLRAELGQEGIHVTTVVPGLMHTGSYVQARFQGQQEREFTWFALGSTLPLISMSAERAARQIVQATQRGAAEVHTQPAGQHPGARAWPVPGDHGQPAQPGESLSSRNTGSTDYQRVGDGGAATPPLPLPACSDGLGPGGCPPVASVYAHQGSGEAPSSGAATPFLSRCTTGLIRLLTNTATCQRSPIVLGLKNRLGLDLLYVSA